MERYPSARKKRRSLIERILYCKETAIELPVELAEKLKHEAIFLSAYQDASLTKVRIFNKNGKPGKKTYDAMRLYPHQIGTIYNKVILVRSYD